MCDGRSRVTGARLPAVSRSRDARQRGRSGGGGLGRPASRRRGVDDLDPLEFERVRQMVGNASAGADRPLRTLSDREIASALGFTRHDAEVTTGGLLMFGKVDAIRRFLPTHEAAFQVLRGLDVEVNDFLPHPLLRLAEEMLTRFKARNTEEEVDFGLLRVAVSAYSEPAFREALANALVHRDYTRGGAVYVQWSEDQLEISSPGGFPAGIRVDNLLVAPPHPRSPLLADAFKREQGSLSEQAGESTECSPSSSASAVRRPTTAGPQATTSSPSCLAALRTCR